MPDLPGSHGGEARFHGQLNKFRNACGPAVAPKATEPDPRSPKIGMTELYQKEITISP